LNRRFQDERAGAMTAEQDANVGEKAISGAERAGDKLKKRGEGRKAKPRPRGNCLLSILCGQCKNCPMTLKFGHFVPFKGFY
jgi:hypothetical protein